MAPFESFGTVSYSYSIESACTMAVSVAISAQYPNVTDTQTDKTDTARRQMPHLCIASCGEKSSRCCNDLKADAEITSFRQCIPQLRGSSQRDYVIDLG